MTADLAVSPISKNAEICYNIGVFCTWSEPVDVVLLLTMFFPCEIRIESTNYSNAEIN